MSTEKFLHLKRPVDYFRGLVEIFSDNLAPKQSFPLLSFYIKAKDEIDQTVSSEFCKKERREKNKLIIAHYPYAVDHIALCHAHGFAVFERLLPRNIKSFCVKQSEPYQDFGVGKLIAANLIYPCPERRVAIITELVYIAQYPFLKDKPFYLHESIEPLTAREKETRDGALRVLMPESLVYPAIEAIKQSSKYVPSERDECLAAEFCLPVSDTQRRLRQLNL